MTETLAKYGLYFDELNKIRVLQPKVAHKTTRLKEECKLFVDKIDEFQRLIDYFINIISKLAAEVENQKLYAVGNRNLVLSMSKHRETMQQQQQALILEKMVQLERMKITHNSMQKTEIHQRDTIHNLQRF